MKPRELAERTCAALIAAGHQAYLVGGCVRDLILAVEPADYDVSTDATPDEVQELFPGSLTVGAQFGVVVVVDPDSQVEVATFRSDVGYADGRHPDGVIYSTSAAEDVRRRDFTVNALLMDPRSGQVLDYVGGRDDIRGRTIRAIGDPQVRFQEDKLRMLRAVRFASRLAYRIEPATLNAISELAPAIAQVSAERTRDELTKLLTEGSARRGFELLDRTRLLPEVLPEVARMKGVQQPPEFHPEGDVWIHTLLMLEMLAPGSSPTLAWGVLLHDVGKPPTFSPAKGPDSRIRFDGHVPVGTAMAEAICRRFRFSNDDTEQVRALVANHLRFKDVFEMRNATLKRFVRLPRFDEHLELHRLDCLSSHGILDNYNFVRRFLAETPETEVSPARLLTGDDLKKLGYKPGPQFREILDSVEDAQLEGRLRSHEEAVMFVTSTFLRPSQS